jgi:hypothetical protein
MEELGLSETVLNLLEISLASGVPASDIIICLWTSCFYRLLENLRRSSLASKIAYADPSQEEYGLGLSLARGLRRPRSAGMAPTATQVSSSLTTAAVKTLAPDIIESIVVCHNMHPWQGCVLWHTTIESIWHGEVYA